MTPNEALDECKCYGQNENITYNVTEITDDFIIEIQ